MGEGAGVGQSGSPLKKVNREAAARAARPKVSGKTAFFREATGRMVWNAQRFKLKLLYQYI